MYVGIHIVECSKTIYIILYELHIIMKIYIGDNFLLYAS